jgi:hypothetical protein
VRHEVLETELTFDGASEGRRGDAGTHATNPYRADGFAMRCRVHAVTLVSFESAQHAEPPLRTFRNTSVAAPM